MSHVFVLRGDLRRLACDDWLLPCAHSRHVSSMWWTPALDASLRAAGAWCGPRDQFGGATMADRAAVPLPDRPAGQPQPWLVDTTGRDPRPAVARTIAFVEAAAASDRRATRRARRLIALPVVGTGAGGARHHAGMVLAELLPALRAAASRLDVDLALVTARDADLAAAQALRTRDDFAALPARLHRKALGLARRARAGRLVLFVGAGASVGAGLPTWDALLDRLATRAGLSPAEMASFQAQHALDRAEYVAMRLSAQGVSVGQAVVDAFEGHAHYGLTHGLLAGLPVTESVTTNYDQLFEAACAAAGRPLAVLPREPAETRGRWLLKMHGCVSRPDDIILTRQNYLRYAVRNAALAGIVQAMLITKHMVFLGFSLRDDNFLRIVDEVRRAVHPDGRPSEPDRRHQLGTALMLEQDPLAASLWTGDLDWLSLADPGGVPEAARTLEVFLDAVGHYAAAQAHLLDPRFDDALDESDRALRALLQPLLDADERAKASPAWAHVQRMLEALGGA